MSKVEKLIDKLLKRPRDFTYDELLKILRYFKYDEMKMGKTSGSRRAFVQQTTKHIIRLHKPHPNNVLKNYQIEDIIVELKNQGLL